MADEAGDSIILLDACCLINLFATGREEEIFRSLPYRFAVASHGAREEVLEIGAASSAAADENPDPSSGDPGSRVSLHPLIAQLIETEALLELETSSPVEERQLVRFAARLDDGEAHTCALARVRGARVATDDRKALRVFQAAWAKGEDLPNFSEPCLRTSDLVFEWADQEGISVSTLTEMLRSIARRATFLPPRSDPHHDRWMELLTRRE